MDILDKVFQLIFARFRRKYGDSQIAFAWRRASYRMTMYTGLTVVACVAMFVIGGYSLFKIGTAAEHRKLGGIAAGVAVLITSFLLDWRFKKYLASPPPLSSQETNAETRYIFYFCVASVGIFVLTCLIGYLLHKVGWIFGE